MPRKNTFLTVTDQFCGAGGSSIGATKAGAEVKLAMNHWKLAIETHNTNFPDTAILWGIERHPKSPAFGELVCPVIFLWKQPGQTLKASAMSGALKHGETVQVTDSRSTINGRIWYHVHSLATNQRPAQAGWVLDSFLKNYNQPHNQKGNTP